MGFEGNILTLLSNQTCMTLFKKNAKYILKIVMVALFHEVEVKGTASVMLLAFKDAKAP